LRMLFVQLRIAPQNPKTPIFKTEIIYGFKSNSIINPHRFYH